METSNMGQSMGDFDYEDSDSSSLSEYAPEGEIKGYFQNNPINASTHIVGNMPPLP